MSRFNFVPVKLSDYKTIENICQIINVEFDLKLGFTVTNRVSLFGADSKIHAMKINLNEERLDDIRHFQKILDAFIRSDLQLTSFKKLAMLLLYFVSHYLAGNFEDEIVDKIIETEGKYTT